MTIITNKSLIISTFVFFLNKGFKNMPIKEFYRIKDIEDRFYPAFYNIYFQSFPIHEQRNSIQQAIAFRDDRYHLIALTEDENILSFIAYWDFDTYVYIEHLAVNSEMRGQNIGSRTLSFFAEVIKKTIILEIDPLIDEVAQKRYRFYEKLGYISNPYSHHHPPYNPEYPPHELVVLSYPRKLNEAEYHQFKADLTQIVMTFKD